MKNTSLSYIYLVWMVIFIVVPLLLIMFFSVTKLTSGGYQFTLEFFQQSFEPIYRTVLLNSLFLAFISTLICLALGYPMALILSNNSKFNSGNIMYFLFVVPMWMNFLLRTYAWNTLLEQNGFLNTALKTLHLPTLNILYTPQAVVLGMVYNFLPFMVLPIYSVLSKMDKSLIEAAEDLGAGYLTVFRKVIFPLSLPGVMSGITMVFMPAVTTFIISKLLGGSNFLLIGDLIEKQFKFTGDWGFGSALSIILMVLILISMGVMSRYENEHQGGGLW